MRSEFLKTLPGVRLAIVFALVFTFAVITNLFPFDVFRSRAHQLQTEEVLLRPAWQPERGQASIQTLDAKLSVPRDLAQVMSKIGLAPAQGLTGVLGVIMALLVLAGVGFRAAARSSRESEERFARIFQSSPLAITISTQKEGRYVDVNDAFLQMLKYERDRNL